MTDLDEPRHRASGFSAFRSILLILAVLGVLVAISAFLMGHDVRTWLRGMSIDFPYYVWRTNVVSVSGVHGLASPALAGTVINPDRPGFPVVAALVGSFIRIDPVALVRVIQVATTLAISLAAGAFAVDVLDEPRWSLPLYVLVMGVSAPLAWTSIKSLDNLLIDAVLMVVAVAAMGSSVPGRGRAAAIAGLAAASLIHWFFLVLFLLLLAGVTVLLIPWSIVARRGGTPTSQTPAGRLGITVVGGAVAAAAALFGLPPGLPVRLPPVRGDNTLVHGDEVRLPSYRLPLTGVLAAIGGWSLWRPDTLKRRVGLVFLGLWALTVFLAQLAAAFTSKPIKVFRVAGFDLALPMLCVAALVGVVHLGRRFGAAGLVVAVVVMGAVVAAFVSAGVTIYRTPESKASAPRIEQVRSAAGYIEALAPGRPVVFLCTVPDPRGVFRFVLAGLPGDRIGPTYLYEGAAKDLLAGRPGEQDADPRTAQVAAGWWKEAWGNSAQILSADPVIIYLDTFNAAASAPPPGATTLGPGVLVLNGPAPTGPATPSPPLGTTGITIALQVLGALLLLGVAGSGWTRWLLPVRPLGWFALSPAVGIGTLALLGTAVGKVGGPAGGTGGLIVLIAIAALGWLPLLIRRGQGSVRPGGGGTQSR